MGFEKFTQFGRGYRPTSSVRTNGQIGFNRGSITRFRLKDGYAVLYYDRDERLIGIQQVDDKDEDGATRLIVRDNNAFVSARSMLEVHGIPYREQTVTYPAEWSEEHGMIVVDLKCPIHRRGGDGAE